MIRAKKWCTASVKGQFNKIGNSRERQREVTRKITRIRCMNQTAIGRRVRGSEDHSLRNMLLPSLRLSAAGAAVVIVSIHIRNK